MRRVLGVIVGVCVCWALAGAVAWGLGRGAVPRSRVPAAPPAPTVLPHGSTCFIAGGSVCDRRPCRVYTVLRGQPATAGRDRVFIPARWRCAAPARTVRAAIESIPVAVPAGR